MAQLRPQTAWQRNASKPTAPPAILTPSGLRVQVPKGFYLTRLYQQRSRTTVSAIPDVRLLSATALAFVPPVCFDKACQEAADRAFFLSVAIPMLVAVVVAYFVAIRRPPLPPLQQPPPSTTTAAARRPPEAQVSKGPPTSSRAASASGSQQQQQRRGVATQQQQGVSMQQQGQQQQQEQEQPLPSVSALSTLSALLPDSSPSSSTSSSLSLEGRRQRAAAATALLDAVAAASTSTTAGPDNRFSSDSSSSSSSSDSDSDRFGGTSSRQIARGWQPALPLTQQGPAADSEPSSSSSTSSAAYADNGNGSGNESEAGSDAGDHDGNAGGLVMFESEQGSGVVFASPEGILPERDKDGELAYRPVSYTPWPVEQGAEGERLRVAVGPVNDKRNRTFVFKPLLPKGRSTILAVSLPRPLGLVMEWQPWTASGASRGGGGVAGGKGRGRVVVVDVVEGTTAEQRLKVASVNRSALERAVLPGDILRAATCTCAVYPTQSLLGMKPPQRHIVLYGADGQSWGAVSAALRKGDSRDGEVVLVLERPLE